MKSSFAKHSLLLFAALRVGDIVSLAAGLWFVPKFVSPEEIGALLPVTSFSTFLSLPLFALAMTAMKESSALSAAGERAKVKALLSGVFVSVAIMLVTGLAVAALVTPHFIAAMGFTSSMAGFLAVAAAFLGCTAPVYTDALQSLKRFRALGIMEAGGALVRFAVMVAVMPFRALAGYFAGAASLPAFRILFGIFALRKDLSIRAEPYWTPQTVRRFTLAFIAILAYQAAPMFTSLVEQSVLRTALSAADSAGYYMASRFSDLLYCATTPLLLVVFPYTAYTAHNGGNTHPYLFKCCAATLATATAMAGIYAIFGRQLITLMPNGSDYLEYARHMPLLVMITALTSCQVFYTNIEVSAGRFGFLSWIIPLHVAYPVLLLTFLPKDLPTMLTWFAAASLLRFAFTTIDVYFRSEKRHVA